MYIHGIEDTTVHESIMTQMKIKGHSPEAWHSNQDHWQVMGCQPEKKKRGKVLVKVRKKKAHSTGSGELDYPMGIHTDSNDTVYMVEEDNHHVSVFTCEGTFLTSFGSEGDGPG